MIKKKTAIFFILLANIILLAHAVVPHHHHKTLVCVQVNHCSNDCDARQHNTSNHEHDDDKNAECCVLKQVVLIPANTLRQECDCLACNDNHSPFIDYQAILFSAGTEPNIQASATNLYAPQLTSSYAHLVNSSLGLRAPPTV